MAARIDAVSKLVRSRMICDKNCKHSSSMLVSFSQPVILQVTVTEKNPEITQKYEYVEYIFITRALGIKTMTVLF